MCWAMFDDSVPADAGMFLGQDAYGEDLAMTQYGAWVSYGGTARPALAAVLLVIGAAVPGRDRHALTAGVVADGQAVEGHLVLLRPDAAVFAVWALVGFGYPSAPVPFAFNAISKLLAFVTVLTLFLPQPGRSQKWGTREIEQAKPHATG